MNGFTYRNPVKVVFGLGALKQAGARRFGVGVNSARSILAEVK
jgi:alcohol dehydrogenase YqhD (iron-dependent ADH family)